MEQEITINENENQIININSSIPQRLKINNVLNNDINVTQSKNQNVNILENKNQTIYIDENGASVNVTDVLVNGSSVVTDTVAYVIVPTKVSQLENDKNYLTIETDPTVPSYIKQISSSDINNWNNKQNLLVSGINIKTINNNSILGAGNIDISEYTAGTGIDITSHVITNTITSYEDLDDLPTIPTSTSQLLNDSDYVVSGNLSEVAFTGSYEDLTDKPFIPDLTSDLTNDSGYIDKDVNDLTYYTLSSSLSTIATTGDYNDLSNKPTIPVVNDATLTIQENGTTLDTFTANSSSNKTVNITVPTSTNDLTNNSGFITLNNLGWTDKTSNITINNSNINTNRTKLYVNEGLRLVFLEVYYGAVVSSTVSRPIEFSLDYKPAFYTSDQLWFVMGGSNGGNSTCRGTIKWDTSKTYIDIFTASTTVNYPFGVIMYPY